MVSITLRNGFYIKPLIIPSVRALHDLMPALYHTSSVALWRIVSFVIEIGLTRSEIGIGSAATRAQVEKRGAI